MIYNKESDFEQALIETLATKGWEREVIKNPTEQDLIDNWANILFENNREAVRLNDTPLTSGEMRQILEEINNLQTPLKLNGFINGKTVSIKRENPEDKRNYGNIISLFIYDPREIAAGRSRYQIVQQPRFKKRSAILNDRKGDLMLLINGMPLIHIELKRSGLPVSKAYHQIEKYSFEGVFTGLFSLIQIFVAMTPEETKYFANPGKDGKFNRSYYFNWADFNNEPINIWSQVADKLLSIPMAHELIGLYTVADSSDKVLKVMRSYQYYAANAISDKVAKTRWKDREEKGGYIWHTTGSGKTMTSFKSAQLIASSGNADKVVFLMDRIELGTQSLEEFRSFANDNEEIQDTKSARRLLSKLKSTDPSETLIVTSIQKMSNIKKNENGSNSYDLELVNSKRIVIIIDEAHRSTFGDMLITIKETFSNALFFGFTGTPIKDENKRVDNTTETVFGKELHTYTIADGIRDKNVLGFDPYKILTYTDSSLRKAVALEKAKATTEKEVFLDEKKVKVYNEYFKKDMIEIENCLNESQYDRKEHREKVVEDILNNWLRLSQNSKFHSIFATSSIDEAVKYYRLFKEKNTKLKITALFDSNIDNNAGFKLKEDGLIEILEDYNNIFNVSFGLSTHHDFKKDISARLAHKKPYYHIDGQPDKQLDILIVVNQMLTGYDSKWLNTLYLDKVLKYEHIIQSFSRTNRLFAELKKGFGTIRYYRRPHTMGKNIRDAIKMYSDNKPSGLLVKGLKDNIIDLGQAFDEIKRIFDSAKIKNFESLPEDITECKQFVKEFSKFNKKLSAARIQGFKWTESKYIFGDDIVEVSVNENEYLILLTRYKELAKKTIERDNENDLPYDIESCIVEISTDRINHDYINDKVEKYLRELGQPKLDKNQLDKMLNEIHILFASLNQEEQKFANILLRDIERGDIVLSPTMSFIDYINEYQLKSRNGRIHEISELLGLDEEKLKNMMNLGVTESNLNDFDRFNKLRKTADLDRSKEYFEKLEGVKLLPYRVNMKIQRFLKNFILDDTIGD